MRQGGKIVERPQHMLMRVAGVFTPSHPVCALLRLTFDCSGYSWPRHPGCHPNMYFHTHFSNEPSNVTITVTHSVTTIKYTIATPTTMTSYHDSNTTHTPRQ